MKDNKKRYTYELNTFSPTGKSYVLADIDQVMLVVVIVLVGMVID